MSRKTHCPKIVFTLAAGDMLGEAGDAIGGPACLLGHLARQFGSKGARFSDAEFGVPLKAAETFTRVIAEARGDDPANVTFDALSGGDHPELFDDYVCELNDNVFEYGKAKWIGKSEDGNERRARIWNRFIAEMGYTEAAPEGVLN